MLAAAGWGLRWLTPGGASAAALVGGLALWGGGPPAGALLALFFVSGSVLTQRQKRQEVQKGQRSRAGTPAAPLRTARQVLANGGWAAAGAMAVPHRPAVGWALVVGALATAQADTWATEIGLQARATPRLITTGRPVPRGTSGGVSALGSAAGLLGAFAMAGLALGLGTGARAAAAGAVAGMLGLFADSLLGATLQATYRCRRCGAPLESSAHCGEPAVRVAGLRWLDNDAVNLAATSVGALAAAALVR